MVRISIILFAVIAYGTLTQYYFEHDAGGTGISSMFDSLWFVIQTITTVGYGDTPIVTFWGKINALAIMLAGIGLLGFFTASVASVFIEYSLSKKFGVKGVKMKNHIILCNWNPIAEEIVHEVIEENLDIVLLAKMEKSPIDHLPFVNGTCLHASDILKTNIADAHAAIVLPEGQVDDELASAIDAKSILGVMNLKKLNPSIHVVIELLKSDSIENAQRAGADEILVTGDILAKLLARGVIDPGTIDIMETILTAKSGEEIFEDDIPEQFIGKKYEEFVLFLLERNATPIAIRNHTGIRVNPTKESTLGKDSFIYIAKNQLKM